GQPVTLVARLQTFSPSIAESSNSCGCLKRGDLSIKEVIQPQVPLRLPCYDFTPVMNHTVVTVLPKVRLATSGATHSHGVTGGVYNARGPCRRGVPAHDYSRFRLCWVGLPAPIRSTRGFMGFAPPRCLATLCIPHCSTCVALAVRAMMT